MNRKTILLAAGGTGGHLYPAEALAEELLRRGHAVIIVTDKRGGVFHTPKLDSAAVRGDVFQKFGDKVKIECVRAATFKPGLFSKIKAVIDIEIGIVQAAVLLLKHRPALIVGFGGYPSFPAVFAGQMTGCPTILHEQNAVLGKANAWLAYAAKKIAVSLPETRGIRPADRTKTVLTGNPVRAEICAVRDVPYPSPEKSLVILTTGGSQAAKIFSDVLPEALRLLPEDIKKHVFVMHQCRAADVQATAEKYQSAGIVSETQPFFNDMAKRLSACHLFIGRSGASTVAEIAVVGRPAIFVPYPGHADQQQAYNAELIANKGGAWVMPQAQFTPEALAAQIETLAKNPAMLENAAIAAKACGQPEAVVKLADLVDERLKK